MKNLGVCCVPLVCSLMTNLFFNCPFSSEVWCSILSECGLNWYSRPWKDWVAMLSTVSKGKPFFSKLLRLSFSNCVYVLWQERNGRIFQNSICNSGMLEETIVSNIRNRMSSFRNLNSLNENIVSNWSLSNSDFT